MFLNPPPHYGFTKFQQWRPSQITAIRHILKSKKKFVACSIPTGGGKSLIYTAAARIGNLGRVLILTSTKGLQDQLIADFAANGMVQIMGKANYPCYEQKNSYCDLGPCNFGYECPLKDAGCAYFDSLAIARNSNLVVTNYHYYLKMSSIGDQNRALGYFDTVICDEGHELPDILADHISLTLDIDKVKEIHDADIPNYGQDFDKWAIWAKELQQRISAELTSLRIAISHRFTSKLATAIAKREKLVEQLQFVAEIPSRAQYRHFCNYDTENNSIKFGPVEFYRYWSDWEMFNTFRKVIIISATLREKSMYLLGLGPEDYDFLDMPSVFPIENSPKIHVSTIRLNRATSDKELADVWVKKIDNIIDSRLDRKGIIHVTSYRYAKVIAEYSRHRNLMFVSTGARKNKELVELFKRAKAPAILVGPAFTTGYDFPDEQCQYQIIGKLPFPNIGDTFLQEKAKHDYFLIPYKVAQTLVQATGRGTRHEKDKCENIIIDDCVVDFVARHRQFFPKWWLDGYKSVFTVPAPIKLKG
jgi:Rad3-related DNA helicase